jgi:hypothetical protein
VSEWNGGEARQISGSLWHLGRGQIFTIEGKTFFTMGGGFCPDEDFREADEARMRWEIPSAEELRRGAETLARAGGKVDYMLTHEPPMRIKGFLQLKQPASSVVESTGLNNFLEELGKCCTFRRWFFGSLHVDKSIASSHASVFRKVLRVE